jgi:nucleotide-binding universal stress UspA family protein
MKDPEQWLQQRIHKILLATDFHQNSRLALSFAVSFARYFKSELTALNAFEFGPYSETVEVVDHLPSRARTDAKELLQKFVAEAGAIIVTSDVVVVEGLVSSAIIKALSELSVDLLVIGTEGIHRGLDHAVLGSNTEALMLGARCLTMTIGPHVPERQDKALVFRKVIYVSDFTVSSTAAATYAFSFGRVFEVDVEVCQLVSKAAINDPQKLKQAAAHYCDILKFEDPELPTTWFDSEYQLSRITSGDELMAKVSEPSNLIVLGVQPASFLQRHLHTSLAYRLLTSAASPVLTVPVTRGRNGHGQW